SDTAMTTRATETMTDCEPGGLPARCSVWNSLSGTHCLHWGRIAVCGAEPCPTPERTREHRYDRHNCRAESLSILQLGRGHDHQQGRDVLDLLALHGLRPDLECRPTRGRTPRTIRRDP